MLEEQKPEPASFKVASMPGWHGSRLVFPDASFGSSKLPVETSFAGLDGEMIAKYRAQGTLKDWQDQIFALCLRNSRLIFALSLAAAPLILPLVKGPRSGGFQLVGTRRRVRPALPWLPAHFGAAIGLKGVGNWDLAKAGTPQKTRSK
jgi:hypothetical protein